MTVTGSFQWTAGVQTGTGTTTIASGATLTIDTDGFKVLDTRTLANNGLVNWSAGAIRTRNAAVIENAGTFDVQFDGQLFNDFGDQSRFHNTGTLRKSAGSGTASIDIPLDNDGTVQVASGTLQILGSVADEQTGQFSALADATLQFGGGNLASGSNVSGGGTVAFTAGTTTIAGTYARRTRPSPGARSSSTRALRSPILFCLVAVLVAPAT